jgi:fucose 4-O-acetylase-like acetyltransferase
MIAAGGTMKKSKADRRLTAQRLVAVFLLGWILFNFPILALFNHPGEILGIPVLYAWLFGVWTALIGLMAWAVEGGEE